MNTRRLLIITLSVISITSSYLIFAQNVDRGSAENEKTVINEMLMEASQRRIQANHVKNPSSFLAVHDSALDSEIPTPSQGMENHAPRHVEVLNNKEALSLPLHSASYKTPFWQLATVPDSAMQQPPIEHTEYIIANISAIQELLLGDDVEIYVPQSARSYFGVVASETHHLGKIRVLEVELNNVYENNNMTITYGEHQTFIALNTPDGIFNIQIDNHSGNGTIVDEMEYRSRQSSIDAIPAPSTPIPAQSPSY